MAFGLAAYPVSFRAKYKNGAWSEEFLEKGLKTQKEEASLSGAEREALYNERNSYPDMPLVSYTSQYANSVFEGLKAFPQKNGGLAVFRPDKNAARFYNSMKGLYMPPFPQDVFVKACLETVKRNVDLGFNIKYDAAWEKDAFLTASAVYIRPFSYSEGGIGVSISHEPWVLIVCSPVTGYFTPGLSGAVVSRRIRAAPYGTGALKVSSNYVISALAKHEAALEGFMECIFLDAVEHKYVEEGSSSNIFFYLKSGELVTPLGGDTILPGITRESILVLAREKGVKANERKISIEEALDETVECFVSGTAAAATPIHSITYNGKKTVFNGGKDGSFTIEILKTLKYMQYGLCEDKKGWMFKV
ncbi:MAG: aminotransferase class IV [Spirochaetaceae bacterium]|jgi:branched-chain amino acid aminotransferase|nr:aminotransferase class IV [Spirochaetaceae bacterium]